MWRALSKTYQNLKQCVSFTISQLLAYPDRSLHLRYREAIECQKRALIGASKTDTFGYAALAELHEQLGLRDEAAEWHKRVIDVCLQPSDAESSSNGGAAPTNTAATSTSTGTGAGPAAVALSPAGQSQNVGLWAKSALAIARWVLGKPRWEDGVIGGSIIHSVYKEMYEVKRYLEIVAATNAGEAREAEDILRAIQTALYGNVQP